MKRSTIIVIVCSLIIWPILAFCLGLNIGWQRSYQPRNIMIGADSLYETTTGTASIRIGCDPNDPNAEYPEPNDRKMRYTGMDLMIWPLERTEPNDPTTCQHHAGSFWLAGQNEDGTFWGVCKYCAKTENTAQHNLAGSIIPE